MVHTSKTVTDSNGSSTTKYLLYVSIVIAQQTGTGNNILWFLYDSDGTKIGFTYNGTSYYYTKNAQGDITGIVDKTAIPLWNTPTTHGANFSTRPIRRATLISVKRTHSSIADITMILKQACACITSIAGYYDPQTGRFLNADGYVSTGQDKNGTNMFAYCGNSPVNAGMRLCFLPV